MLTIKTKDMPQQLKAICKSMSSRRSGWVTITNEVRLYPCYWDGGSRPEYASFDTASGRAVRRQDLPVPAFKFGEHTGSVTYNIEGQSGIVVCCAGVSCGKAAFPHLYMTQETWDALNK